MNNPETVKKTLKAVQKGYEFAIENPDAAAEILSDAALELDPEIVKESQSWLKDQYKAEVGKWGHIDQARWDEFYQWLFESGLVDIEIPEGSGFTNEYLPE